MEYVLPANEIRILGCLVEKELTTPEYYPLTLNALVNACNQKSNRNPVMSLTADDVEDAIEGLRKKQLVWRRSCAGARVSKYEHNFNVKWELTPEEVALLCVLLLRGSQTAGEIKGRYGRMHEFPTLDAVLSVLNQLQEKEGGPFVILLPRQPGLKESRYMHLFSGEPEIVNDSECMGQDPVTPVASSSGLRIDILESTVRALHEEVSLLRSQFEEFKKSFE